MLIAGNSIVYIWRLVVPLEESWSQTESKVFEKSNTHVKIRSEKLSKIAKNIIKHVTDKQRFPKLVGQVAEEIVSVIHDQKPIFLKVVIKEVWELDI